MAFPSERKACTACRKAKQKCGKQDPQCTRCVERALDCIYPSPKGSCWIPTQDLPSPFPNATSSTIIQEDTLATASLRNTQGATVDFEFLATGSGSLSDPSSIWFLRPETWEVRHSPRLENKPYTSIVLKNYVKTFRSWLSQWVMTASNPFIHSHIYRHHIPRCVQDAYSTVAIYDQKTVENEETVFRIITDRVSCLFDDYHPAALNVYDILARVHALLVYQIIRLYDGDVKLRHDAEDHIPVLTTWTEALISSAASSASTDSFLTVANIDDLAPTLCGLETPERSISEVLWNAWILAESVRRTWMMTASLKSIYLAMKRGWAPCPGAVMYTTREGVWDAKSAVSWDMMCSGVNIGFMHREESEELFNKAAPDEVDQFAKAIMTISFGAEKMGLWEIESRRKNEYDSRGS